MIVKVDAFPVVYFNARCRRHQSNVEVSIVAADLDRNHMRVGGNVTAMRCEKGGPQCTDDWELQIAAGGEIRIES